MLHSKQIADKLVRDDVIRESDRVAVEFGLKQLFTVLRSLSITFLISILLQNVIEYVIFLLFFWPLRIYAGGYHAKTSRRCLVLSVLSVFVILELSDRLILSQYTIAIITYLLALILYKLIPQGNEKRKLDKIEYEVYRKKGRCILVIEVAISLLMHLVGYYIGYTLIMYSFSLMIILLLTGGGYLKRCVRIDNQFYT